jgi:hypothetical protein
MKWLADWHQVRGVNLMNTHSFNPRAPYDRDSRHISTTAGSSRAMAALPGLGGLHQPPEPDADGGRHVCPVAFLHVGQSMHAGKAVRPEAFTSTLQDALLDCDWVLYDAWEDSASLAGREIRLHKEEYSILVVPPVEIIPHATLAKAKAFFEQGGIVVGYDFLPTKSGTLDKTSADIAVLRKAIWGDAAPGLTASKTNAAGGRSYFLPGQASVADVRQALVEDAGVRPTLDVIKGETGNWLHVLHRIRSGRDTFLVCNQHHEGEARAFTFRIQAAGEPECWDAMRNEITAVPYRRLSRTEVEVDLTLEPSESVLLVFQRRKRALPMRLTAAAVPLRAPIEIMRGDTPPELIIPSTPLAPAAAGRPLEGAQWVWFPEDTPGPSARHFRGAFTVPAGRKIKAAQFFGTCDNVFTLHVNGQEAGRSPGSPRGLARGAADRSDRTARGGPECAGRGRAEPRRGAESGGVDRSLHGRV